MSCDKMSLKLQALADNELNTNEIPEILEHIKTCKDCNDEYISLLQLNKSFSSAQIPAPPREWFEELAAKKWRKSFFSLANLLLLVSNIGIFVFLLISMFMSAGISMLLKVLIGTGVASLLVFLTLTIHERFKESREDKYREILK